MTQTPDPRCWWCHQPTPAETGYRGNAPQLELPAGVVICGPDCPRRPPDTLVWTAGKNRIP